MRNSIVKVILTMSVTDVLLLGLNGEIEIVVLQHIEVSEPRLITYSSTI